MTNDGPLIRSIIRRLEVDFLDKRNLVKMQMSPVFFLIPGYDHVMKEFSQKIATK